MITGILGKKIGMTQLFQEDGQMVPVTVIEAGPCVVTQLKTRANDGYDGAQVGFEEQRKANKPETGHLKGHGLFRHLREVPVDQLGDLQVGQKVTVSLFSVGDKVNVIGTSKGRGFQGVVKRHHFKGGPKTHGASDRLRAPGAIGSNTFPARVFKGKRMPGHMGDERVTVRNLQVVRVDEERNLLMIRGAVPGARSGLLTIKRADAAKAKES
ncbi:MAG: 50S ribosomal protein L3 [Chloroflexota bacterium]|nr:50S ribosomal protein L3 [Chloroflexota bacterium]